ncbi:hypothetical protein [Phytohabitans aurantiacus]|jgi:hypothetical protein|uniref:Lipoprotein n=1 Tax=Phytohabitans aurantiacus TaxID=3016789 RepID=A0ABQ5QQQ2_9ACTN|nr:hypothetical protein [Phytohabitans aurantiacus]GLH96544.1 hypothetical protein Pa4123_18180 [Phytohabitans aurantiacus]
MNHARKVLAALTVSLALAGCGSEPEPRVASATDAPARPAATTDVRTRYVEAQRKWVACMRKQGFDLPDPDAKGQVDFRGLGDGGELKMNPKWSEAQNACREFNIDVSEEDLYPLTAEQIANARAYSACRRANGRPDYPDPKPNGYMPEDWGRELTPAEEQADRRASAICAPVQDGLPPNPNATIARPQG